MAIIPCNPKLQLLGLNYYYRAVELGLLGSQRATVMLYLASSGVVPDAYDKYSKAKHLSTSQKLLGSIETDTALLDGRDEMAFFFPGKLQLLLL